MENKSNKSLENKSLEEKTLEDKVEKNEELEFTESEATLVENLDPDALEETEEFATKNNVKRARVVK